MKYFIDCGTHLFQGLKQFSNIYSFDQSWTIYSFEANPKTFALSKAYLNDGLEKLNIIHKNLAVSDKDGKIIVNCDSNNNDATGQGSNILSAPPDYDIVHPHKFTWVKEEVECFNFSKFISNLENVDTLVIKLDIEGEEFNVLDRMIEDESYTKINDLYVEFHERFFLNEINKYTNLKDQFIRYFQKRNINIINWL